MDLVVWGDELSVGSAIIDEQHKKLIGIMNEMHVSMNRRDDRSQVAWALDELFGYFDVHLAYEEDLLAREGYPEIEDHRAMHDLVRERIFRFRQQLGNDEADAREVLKFLIEWFQSHTRDADQKYARFLADRR